MTEWLYHRYIIARYGVGMILVGLIVTLGPKVLFRQALAANKEWHNRLESV